MSCPRTTTQWCQWGANPWPFCLEASTLPLSHYAPMMHSSLSTSNEPILFFYSCIPLGSSNDKLCKSLSCWARIVSLVEWPCHINTYQEYSGPVVKCSTRSRGVAGSSLTDGMHCVLEQDTYSSAVFSTGSTQEDPSQHNWKIVDRDVKNQIKQNEYIPYIDNVVGNWAIVVIQAFLPWNCHISWRYFH